MISTSDIDQISNALDELPELEFWAMSLSDLCFYLRRYAKNKGYRLSIDHVRLSKILESFDTHGFECPIIAEHPQIEDLLDVYYHKFRICRDSVYGKLDSAKSMPEVSKRLQQLQNHWHYKQTFNATVPVQKPSALNINMIKIEMPKILESPILTSEEDALQAENLILKQFSYEFQQLSEGGLSGQQVP